MFNVPNEYYLSSPSSPSLIFNHQQQQQQQQHNTHYHHPYSQISASCYPTHTFDDNRIIQNYDHNFIWNDNDIKIGGQTGAPRVFKRRVSANKKERRRTQSINTAFSDLRTAIPNVQPDTKLSKIKTLKLAAKYIEFLMDILSKDDSTTMPNTFKAEIVKTRRDHRDLIKFDNSSNARKVKGRTGWPQTVWQSELNRRESFHQYDNKH
ncbi:unnamed protein product [Rotaria magnacalcarata]|uniref:BHLH domain-containing protein n=1 Tax=Rotaria magnacalcarata TaxID=392030 RepID=A0A818ZIV5_9BILA|nr:unnamed protein product [Rotaria magnacalcarata]CAF1530711.1 unnamed protein product [Rotaria magnacalcarata]CAF1935842.1 unnamed protein product [Rotaria magnacalcarata]CAF2022418.1 unnamed protein product [Rotaria magnacalcarata]CAF2125943.1 unnamed protein product [Rotaria magnacalcarata]